MGAEVGHDKSSNGVPTMHQAITDNDVEALRKLLDNGADLNERGSLCISGLIG